MSGSRTDGEARRRIREDLDATLVVEAAAGTGKTTELVRRIVAVLRSGRARLEQVVAVTFTEKAAGEMKLRLRAEIERARTAAATADAERTRLVAALEQLEAARIGTIHAFCADLLHERPVEARIDPIFETAAQDGAERLYDEAFGSWFQETLAKPPEGVRRLLRRRPRGRDDDGPREALRAAGWRLAEHRDFDAPWRRDPFDRDPAIDALVTRIAEVGRLASRCSDAEDWLAKSLAALARFAAELERREAVRGRDHDGLEAELRDLARPRWDNHWKWRGRGKMLGEDLERAAAIRVRDALKEELDRFLADADADLAACLHGELGTLVERYVAGKERTGSLDFLDLLVRARDLVRDDARVRAELQERFTHLFLDEFQDTDPLQAEILILLAAADPGERDWTRVVPRPGKLFVVGDPKQSIYRFRRADVALYQSIKRRLLDRGAADVYLTTSFRSAPGIQKAVNAAFSLCMAEGPSQARYVPLEPDRADPDARPTVVVLPVPRPYSHYGKVTKWAVEESEPDAVGAYVEWLTQRSGWMVSERRPAGDGDAREIEVEVKLEPRHVCILLKRFQSGSTDLTRGYVEALEARRIPHVLVGGRSFHAREEVQAVRSALTAIEWPDDELAVYAALRGPFFALGDDALLAFRAQLGSLHPLRRIEEATELDERVQEVAAALRMLAALHFGRNRHPIADTISRLLERTRAHAGVAIWPAGEQALANLLRMTDLARRFEAAGATSFRAFVERLQAEADRGDASEAPVVEEGTEGVRIMTVHRAKGLEFPVVILADPTAVATAATPSRHVEPDRRLWAEPLAWCAPRELLENAEDARRRDREEAVRLAYVAATRARDLLVVSCVGDERVEGWVDVLHPVLYPAEEGRRRPRPAAGAGPGFGDDSVLERPDAARRGPAASVAPGAHTPGAGAHEVVWWDPRALALDRQHDGGLRQQRLLVADERDSVAPAGIRSHAAWQARRSEVLATGAHPSCIVRTVLEIARDASAGQAAPPLPVTAVPAAPGHAGREPTLFDDLLPERPVPARPQPPPVGLERVTAARDWKRPHGKRFGTLVHALLATVPLEAAEDGVRLAAIAAARLLGAPPGEADAAVAAVLRALAHPLLRRAARSAALGGCQREAPVLLRLDDDVLAEGVVDLAFRETRGKQATWTVVDFKTDADLEGRRAEYEAQVRLYARAIAAATGESAAAVLLLV